MSDEWKKVDAKWRNYPASEKQMALIRNLQKKNHRLPPFIGTTKGEASTYIEAALFFANLDKRLRFLENEMAKDLATDAKIKANRDWLPKRDDNKYLADAMSYLYANDPTYILEGGD